MDSLSGIKWRSSPIGILDFDIETRLVGFYQAGKFNPSGSEPTSIAASWVGDDEVYAWFQPEYSVPELLECFRPLYNKAVIVTGHYIRKFDLPILNGACLEWGLPMLREKLACDTKCDLVDFAAISKSQENLGDMLRLVEAKYHMNDNRWRSSTRLTPDGVDLSRKRVVGDVLQHKQLRLALLEAGALKPPSMWRP